MTSRSASVQAGTSGSTRPALRSAHGRLPDPPRRTATPGPPPLLLEQLRLAQHAVERLAELLPVAAERVAGARGDQRLDHPLVAEPEVDPLDEVGQRRERRVLRARR